MIVEKYYLQTSAIERAGFLMNKGFTIHSYKEVEENGEPIWVIKFVKQDKALARH